MPEYSTDRRGVLKILSGIGATCAAPSLGDELHAQEAPHTHAAPAAPTGAYFTAGDLKLVSRVADLIIPATDTPGASGAGVPAYIDQVVARDRAHQAVFADGLRWLDKASRDAHQRPFLELSETQQLGLLEPVCKLADSRRRMVGRHVEWFRLMKNLTADGYYTSAIGLREELGYPGNAALTSFPECTHEH